MDLRKANEYSVGTIPVVGAVLFLILALARLIGFSSDLVDAGRSTTYKVTTKYTDGTSSVKYEKGDGSGGAWFFLIFAGMLAMGAERFISTIPLVLGSPLILVFSLSFAGAMTIFYSDKIHAYSDKQESDNKSAWSWHFIAAGVLSLILPSLMYSDTKGYGGLALLMSYPPLIAYVFLGVAAPLSISATLVVGYFRAVKQEKGVFSAVLSPVILAGLVGFVVLFFVYNSMNGITNVSEFVSFHADYFSQLSMNVNDAIRRRWGAAGLLQYVTFLGAIATYLVLPALACLGALRVLNRRQAKAGGFMSFIYSLPAWLFALLPLTIFGVTQVKGLDVSFSLIAHYLHIDELFSYVAIAPYHTDASSGLTQYIALTGSYKVPFEVNVGFGLIAFYFVRRVYLSIHKAGNKKGLIRFSLIFFVTLVGYYKIAHPLVKAGVSAAKYNVEVMNYPYLDALARKSLKDLKKALLITIPVDDSTHNGKFSGGEDVWVRITNLPRYYGNNRERQLELGTYDIEVVADGYKTYRNSITLSEYKVYRISPILYKE